MSCMVSFLMQLGRGPAAKQDDWAYARCTSVRDVATHCSFVDGDEASWAGVGVWDEEWEHGLRNGSIASDLVRLIESLTEHLCSLLSSCLHLTITHQQPGQTSKQHRTPSGSKLLMFLDRRTSRPPSHAELMTFLLHLSSISLICPI